MEFIGKLICFSYVFVYLCVYIGGKTMEGIISSSGKISHPMANMLYW